MPSGAGVPAVFMTAKARQEEVAALKLAGALEVIAKPFDPMTLADTLRPIWDAQALPARKPEAPAIKDDAEAQQVLEETLRQIAAEFAADGPAKLAEMAQALAAFDEPGDRAERLVTLRRLVHSMRGSALTLGFAEVGATAQAVEMKVREAMAESDLRKDVDIVALRRSFEPLRFALAKIEAGAAPEPGRGRAPSAVAAFTPQVPSPTAPARESSRSRALYLIGRAEGPFRRLAADLSELGYDVHRFDSSADVVEATRDRSPLAIVVRLEDIAGTGEAWAQAISNGAAASIPLLFVSAHDGFANRLQAVRLGARSFFREPVKLPGLIDTLDELEKVHTELPYRVVLVEDSEVQAAHTAAMLRAAGMETLVISDPKRLPDALGEFGADLILMDMNLPGCSGDEVARVIRQMEAFMSIPIVFLSVEQDFDRQLAALGHGGDEFLTKPIFPWQLVSVVSSRIQRYRQLRALMLHDSLTGLLNHSRLQQQIDMETAKALRYKLPLTLTMIDIDHFKRVNDTHGHPTGDRVLKSLARFLMHRLRRISDVVGRYGGEEFAVVLANTDATAAFVLIDAMREEFAQVVHESDQGNFCVTFSAGIAQLSGHRNGRDLVLAADRAMYRAKSFGRNRVECDIDTGDD